VTPANLRGPARGMVTTVLGRPDLWWTALGALRRLSAPGWWKAPPFLPLPDGELWGFRMTTAYGRPDAEPVSADVISYLEWCRSTAARGRLFRNRPPTHRPSGPGPGRPG
jgi:hypothetical protein